MRRPAKCSLPIAAARRRPSTSPTAASLSDVIAAINAAGLGITAAINAQGHGITLTDTTGATTSNLIVADVGGGTTAANLNIVADVAATTVKSGDLHRRYINEATTLASLNGGDGIVQGSFKITDKAGASAIINLTGTTFQTVGDVMSAINAAAVGVTASINSTGDGILLTDTSGGGGSLSVEEFGGGTNRGELANSSAAARRRSTAPITYNVDVRRRRHADRSRHQDSIERRTDCRVDLQHRRYRPDAVAAKRFEERQCGPSADRFRCDVAQSDAIADRRKTPSLELSGSGSTPLLFTSSTNSLRFDRARRGVSIISALRRRRSRVTVSDNSETLVAAMNQFVSGFNSISSNLTKQTAFDAATRRRAACCRATASRWNCNRRCSASSADSTVRRRIRFATSRSSASRVKGGQLSFDAAKLQAALADDPDGRPRVLLQHDDRRRDRHEEGRQ